MAHKKISNLRIAFAKMLNKHRSYLRRCISVSVSHWVCFVFVFLANLSTSIKPVRIIFFLLSQPSHSFICHDSMRAWTRSVHWKSLSKKGAEVGPNKWVVIQFRKNVFYRIWSIKLIFGINQKIVSVTDNDNDERNLTQTMMNKKLLAIKQGCKMANQINFSLLRTVK